jgi:hypothetical protein
MASVDGNAAAGLIGAGITLAAFSVLGKLSQGRLAKEVWGGGDGDTPFERGQIIRARIGARLYPAFAISAVICLLVALLVVVV